MKTVLWTMAILGGMATVAWVLWPTNHNESPRPSVSQREECRTLIGRQGQPRHWRACLLKSR